MNRPSCRRLRRDLAPLLLAFVWLVAPAQGHEGHDHGAPPPPVSATIAPRGDASSSDFEIVAIARGNKLSLYLDSFPANVPVRDAQIEVDTPQGTQKAIAEAFATLSAGNPAASFAVRSSATANCA